MLTLPRRTFLRATLPAAAALLPAATLARALGPQDPSPHPTPPPPHPLTREEDRYTVKRPLPNGTTTFKVSSADCRNDFFAMEHHHTSKGGPALHRHTVEDEFFYVLAGEYRVMVGTTLYTLHTGDSVLGPRGTPHTFAFVGPADGRMLITYAPAGKMEEFFSYQDEHAARSYTANADRARAVGIERLGPPLATT